ncbi:MAG TPA: peroxiredoxin [Nitrososphaeraceae archaeon]|jgi:peroxiredoxin|nr:peroxiredoxin [Nitrososphaeraceae archaeon]
MSNEASYSYRSAPDIGDSAPDFDLADADLKMQKLSNYKGKPVVLAFFPAAESPVCTKEMCTFRDSLQELKGYDAQILGISVDGPFANKIFTENRHLNFPILSDYKRETINNYGIVMPNLGPLQDYNAAKRSIFVLDSAGKIRYKWISDNPLIEPNYEEIRAALAKLKTGS